MGNSVKNPFEVNSSSQSVEFKKKESVKDPFAQAESKSVVDKKKEKAESPFKVEKSILGSESGTESLKGKEEVSSKSSENEITVLEWVASMILMWFPVVNIICAIGFMISPNSTVDKVNWAKANLILIGILTGIILIFYLLACTVWYPYFAG